VPDLPAPGADLRRVANEHWRDSYRVRMDLLRGEWREFGTVQAYSAPHIDYPFANGCVVLDPADPSDLAAAMSWLGGRPVAYRVWMDHVIATPALVDVPLSLGLEGDGPWRLPAMVLPSIPVAPPLPAGIQVCRVGETLAADLRSHLVDAASPHRAFLSAVLDASIDSDQLVIYIARLDDRIAATSAVIRTGLSCGIYAVGTAEWARRRGVGTAVTWATLEHARTEWGCTAAALQASPVGVLVYGKMGFEPAAEYLPFDSPLIPR
jgi:hypothetical protein